MIDSVYWNRKTLSSKVTKLDKRVGLVAVIALLLNLGVYLSGAVLPFPIRVVLLLAGIVPYVYCVGGTFYCFVANWLAERNLKATRTASGVSSNTSVGGTK